MALKPAGMQIPAAATPEMDADFAQNYSVMRQLIRTLVGNLTRALESQQPSKTNPAMKADHEAKIRDLKDDIITVEMALVRLEIEHELSMAANNKPHPLQSTAMLRTPVQKSRTPIPSQPRRSWEASQSGVDSSNDPEDALSSAPDAMSSSSTPGTSFSSHFLSDSRLKTPVSNPRSSLHHERHVSFDTSSSASSPMMDPPSNLSPILPPADLPSGTKSTDASDLPTPSELFPEMASRCTLRQPIFSPAGHGPNLPVADPAPALEEATITADDRSLQQQRKRLVRSSAHPTHQTSASRRILASPHQGDVSKEQKEQLGPSTVTTPKRPTSRAYEHSSQGSFSKQCSSVGCISPKTDKLIHKIVASATTTSGAMARDSRKP